MRRVRRTVVLLVAALAVVSATMAPALAGPESTFVSRINASRAAAGLAPLDVHGDLVDDARAWSQAMMDAGSISHNPNLASVTTGWEALGENVGVGPDENSLHDAFMASSGHRANILGDYTHVGVGVVVESADRMWVTVIFMRAVGAPATTTTTSTTTTTAAPTPPTTVTTVAVAAEPTEATATAATSRSTPAEAEPRVEASRQPVPEMGRSPSLAPFAV